VGNQSTPSLGGAWLDVELELLKLPAPMLGKFSPYQDNAQATDPRLPRSLMTSSCDSLITTGWPLHESFSGYYNKVPPKINQVDADQIMTVLCLWMGKLLTQQARVTNVDVVPFNFTFQDLYLVVRSALLTVFDNQYFTQFLGNNQWTSIATNAFLGFFVMGHCSGRSEFGNFQLPVILAENISAMKARTIGSPGSKNPQAYLPIVGRWYLDTPPNFQIEKLDGSLIDMFAPLALLDTIDLIDCTNNNNYINVQGEYYLNVMSNWNEAVKNAKAQSAPVQPINTDGGPRGLLVAMSGRLLKKIDNDELTKKHAAPIRLANTLKYVKNKPYAEGADKEGRKYIYPNDVKALPSASVLNLTTNSILSRFQATQEMMSLFQLLILPTERVDDENDVLSQSMLQVMGKYAHSFQLSNYQATATGAGEWNRLNLYANELITGLGRDENSKFQEIFGHLIKEGKGGFLSQILGGAVNSFFPGNEALVNGIASMVPF